MYEFFWILSPELLSSAAQMGRFHYYVTVPTEAGDSWVNHCLYKCNEKDLECEMIFDEARMGSIIYPTTLIVDNNTQEIHYFLDWELIYTDGLHPHEYELIDVGATDKFYFAVYTYEKDTTPQFVVSKCDGSFSDKKTACEILPFHYSINHYEKAELEASKGKNEIMLTIDDVEVFSYDTAPHCKVEGCIID